MTTEILCKKIVDQLGNNLHPRKCSWGETFPTAYEQLFRYYREDLIKDIKKVLDEASLFDLAARD